MFLVFCSQEFLLLNEPETEELGSTIFAEIKEDPPLKTYQSAITDFKI
jgi:hypothetical protein